MVLVQNRTALATSASRRDALDIVDAGLAAIDTTATLRAQIKLIGDRLSIGDHSWDLTRFHHLHVLGFGKASCAAALALDEILGARIHRGIMIGQEPGICKTIDIYEATHPLPSEQNALLTKRLVQKCEEIGPDDLVLVVVSGGGSAMLCWPASECEQGKRLYEASLEAGLTVHELNIVRKHLSALKGGGLAKLLHPATVVGLVISDVPADRPDLVASGPTYLDPSTMADAQTIIDRYDLGQFDLVETTKDPSLFANVTNIVLISSATALEAMAHRARTLGYDVFSAGPDRYDTPEALLQYMQELARPSSVVLAGGEPTFAVAADHGVGGRNQHTALVAATILDGSQVFASIASDGMDNGPHAGALVDSGTILRARAHDMDLERHRDRSDETPVLQATGDLVEMEPTGSNVSDLLILLTP